MAVQSQCAPSKKATALPVRDNGYCIGEQRMLRRGCANAQSRKSFRYSHIQNIYDGDDEGSDLIIDT